MKIIHCADLHLGSPVNTPKFGGFNPAEAPWQALERLITLATSEKVTALLIAGDIFDSHSPDPRTERRFASALERVSAAGIATYLIYGNHDADYNARARLSWPEGVTAFPSDSAATYQFSAADVSVALHGRSFPPGDIGPEFVQSYPAPMSGTINIGLLHSSLESPDWAPVSVKNLLGRGYDYWGLGHVHKPQLFENDGGQVAAYAGIPQGRDIGETGPHGCTLLTLSADGNIARDFRRLDSAEWRELLLDVSAYEELNAVSRAAIALVEEQNTEVPLIVRLRLIGSSPLAAALYAYSSKLAEDLEAAAPVLNERLLIEQVRCDVQQPATEAKRAALGILPTRDAIQPESLRLLKKKLADDARSALTPTIDTEQAEGIAQAILTGQDLALESAV